jgi:hypothetical protein
LAPKRSITLPRHDSEEEAATAQATMQAQTQRQTQMQMPICSWRCVLIWGEERGEKGLEEEMDVTWEVKGGEMRK